MIKVSKSNTSNSKLKIYSKYYLILVAINNNFSPDLKNDHNAIAETKSNLSMTLIGGVGTSVNLGSNHTKDNPNNRSEQGQPTGRVRSKIEPVELEQKDIPDLNKVVEEEFIINLREEKAKEIKKKEEEVKIKQIAEKEKEVVRIENTRKQKEIDGKKFTFDVSGNPVNIRNVVVEKLAYDFSLPK